MTKSVFFETIFPMLVLGIESTCDETALALVRNGKEVLAHKIASSIDIHQKYGGVFPELASRRHFDAIVPLLKEVLCVSPQMIDLIAVADGPGLIGALLVGLQTAKGLALAWDKPFIGVNHVEAHLFAAIMNSLDTLPLPALGLVLSGGHTFLIKIHSIGNYELLGTTVDDALGEAFDKVGALVGLPYPAGPLVEKLARLGDPRKYSFKAGTVKTNPLNFSLSGLKTSVLYTLQKEAPYEGLECDIAASFQQAAFTDLIKKTKLALELHSAQALIFGGGVTNNQTLRSTFIEAFPDLPLFFPEPNLSLDNAIMIAALGHWKYRQIGKGADLDLSPKVRYDFPSWTTVAK